MKTVLFVNATIVFSENRFLVIIQIVYVNKVDMTIIINIISSLLDIII